MGIKLWLVPQISEHWPKYSPGELHKKLIWLRRPGTASAFTPSDGIVHEWRTSAAVMRLRIWELIGIRTLLSTSNSRNELLIELESLR